MDLLLDTHTFLWWDAGTLPRAVVRRIKDADDIYVSAASAWEIAIKVGLGKIQTRTPLAEAIRDYGFRPMPIRLEHGDAVRSLPRHHRDPFDRMLVAQATVEGVPIVSRDPHLAAYGIAVLWS